MGAKDKDGLLTETELEMMGVLWRLGGATVHEVLQALPPDRKLAYTSVSTMLRILEQKDFVRSEKVGRGFRYLPKVEKRDYESRSVTHLVDRVFEGVPTELIRCLLDQTSLKKQEREQIQKILRDNGVRT